MLEWFTDLFTAASLGYFCLGVGVASAWHLIKARFTGKIVIFRWKYIAVPAAIGIALYMSIQTQQNADCVREFQHVLRERSSVTSDNDRISQYQRTLVYDWIHNLVWPPPEIAKLDGADPARQKWAIDLTLETDRKFRASIDEQQENDEFRAAHPLPPPTCGL